MTGKLPEYGFDFRDYQSHPWIRTDVLRDGRQLRRAIEDVPDHGTKMYSLSIGPHDQKVVPFDLRVVTDSTGLFVLRIGFVGGRNGNIMVVCDGAGFVIGLNTTEGLDSESCKLDLDVKGGKFISEKPTGYTIVTNSEEIAVFDTKGSRRIGLKHFDAPEKTVIVSSDSWVDPKWSVDLSQLSYPTLVSFPTRVWADPYRAQQMADVMESLISQRIKVKI